MSENILNDGNPITASEVKPSTKRATRARKKPQSAPKPEVGSTPRLGIFRLRDDVETPIMATSESACFDVRANFYEGMGIIGYDDNNKLVQLLARYYTVETDGGLGIVVNPGYRILVPTGLHFDIPTGYSVRMHPRSGLSVRNGLTLINGEGVIDSDYVGECYIPIVNHSSVRQFIRHNERYAQIEMVEHLKYELKTISLAPAQKTTRTGGYGHTGTT